MRAVQSSTAWRCAVLRWTEVSRGRTAFYETSRLEHPYRHLVTACRNISAFHSITARRQTKDSEVNRNVPSHKDVLSRKQELEQSTNDLYPRMRYTALENVSDRQPSLLWDLQAFREKHTTIEQLATADSEDQICGRVASIRSAGSKLTFIDLVQEPGEHGVQIVLKQNALPSNPGLAAGGNPIKSFTRLVRRGDSLSVKGHAHCNKQGQLCIVANQLPTILSPCLHHIPTDAFGEDSDWAHDKHVEMLTDDGPIKSLVARSVLLQTLRSRFAEHKFIEVQTPILAGAAGGATARPFETSATEFSNRKLSLRVAPELWLKRLILGGMSRIFEVGSCFRNEGLDKTHNPEFTSCEFYAAFWTLPMLQQFTQDLLVGISQSIETSSARNTSAISLSKSKNDADISSPWPSIDFIPALNEALDLDLPNLASFDARQQLMEIFTRKNIPLPSKPTLPRLLDKLSSLYLEPTCERPTWITNIPECMSPLAKSFVHPTAPNAQSVAARSELFIQHKEVVNCYEEENSPFEQRRKFVEQQVLARLSQDNDSAILDEEAMKLDEDYLRALEWGLPPTGGWGCGIDRLLMLFTGRDRIEDVLSFGDLRSVTRTAQREQKETTRMTREENSGI